MTNLNRRLASIATGQLGAFSREQAHDVGATDDQLRSRVMSGFLAQPGPNVFTLVGSDINPRAQLRVLLLDIGGDVVASRFTAAALHGFDGYRLRPPFDVSIGAHRFVRRSPHRVHQVTGLEVIDRGEIDGVAVTRPARTLIDLARHETEERLRIAYDSGLRDGLLEESSLHRRIVALRRSGRHGVPALLRAIEGATINAGGHSWLEREFLRLVADAGIDRPDTQVVLARTGDRMVRVDFFFPGSSVVVEVMGYTYHSTKEQLRRDAERTNALLARGFRPFQFTYETIVESPNTVVDTVRLALATDSAESA